MEQGLGSARGKNTNFDAAQGEVQELKVDCYLLSENNGVAATGTYPLIEGLVRTQMFRQAEVVSTLSSYLDIVYQVIDIVYLNHKMKLIEGILS